MYIILGLILIGGGIYVAWEAHSILNWALFQLATLMEPGVKITSADLQVFNSFLTDFLYNIGADTYAEMQRYLTVARIVGIVGAILGGLLTFTRIRRH